MRILHCCLAAFYIDNYGYQENILPRMHKLQGHEVKIIASTETYIDNKKLGYINPSSYFTSESIPIVRIPYTRLLPKIISRKLRAYNGLAKLVKDFSPDIIFLHDIQFLSIREITNYAKKNKVKIYADCHTDFINSGKNWFSRNILHRLIYKWCAKTIEPYTRKFYGTLPARVEFLRSVYQIQDQKLDLLVFGADNTQYKLENRDIIRKKIRSYYKIGETDFVIVTGGKIDKRKKIHVLMEAFQNLKIKEIKLVVFGSINDDIKDRIEIFRSTEGITFIDWLPVQGIYEVLVACDLGFFPGTHSVLWEQSIGIGLPCVFKRWDGIQHVDIGGNCLFIDDVSAQSIRDLIIKIYNDKPLVEQMKKIAVASGVSKFSYSRIAQYAIEQ